LIIRNNAGHREPSIELITQRSQVQILPPQPIESLVTATGTGFSQFANKLRKPKGCLEHNFSRLFLPTFLFPKPERHADNSFCRMRSTGGNLWARRTSSLRRQRELSMPGRVARWSAAQRRWFPQQSAPLIRRMPASKLNVASSIPVSRSIFSISCTVIAVCNLRENGVNRSNRLQMHVNTGLNVSRVPWHSSYQNAPFS
jgi:hypothetical protein